MGCGSSKNLTRNIIPSSLQSPYLPPGQYCQHCSENHLEAECSMNLHGTGKYRNNNSLNSIPKEKRKRHLLKKKSTYFEEDRVVDPSRPHLISQNPPSMVECDESLKNCEILGEKRVEADLDDVKNFEIKNCSGLIYEEDGKNGDNGKISNLFEEGNLKEENNAKLLEFTLPEFNSNDLRPAEKHFVSSDEELDEILEIKGYMSPIYMIPGKYNPENFDDIVKRKGVKEILEFDEIREKLNLDEKKDQDKVEN